MYSLGVEKWSFLMLLVKSLFFFKFQFLLTRISKITAEAFSRRSPPMVGTVWVALVALTQIQSPLTRRLFSAVPIYARMMRTEINLSFSTGHQRVSFQQTLPPRVRNVPVSSNQIHLLPGEMALGSVISGPRPDSPKGVYSGFVPDVSVFGFSPFLTMLSV